MTDDPHSIPFPFIWLFFFVWHYKNWKRDYYDTHSLFWSITRLFNLYWRISEECLNYEHKNEFNSAHLACDIENFMIRYKIVLDNILYILSLVYSEYNIRWLSHFSQQGYINSFKNVYNQFLKNEKLFQFHPEIVELLRDSKEFLFDKSKYRDLLIHNKANVTIFEFKNELRYSIDTLSGNLFWVTNHINGTQTTNTSPVMYDINWDMYSLISLLNNDLYKLYKDFFLIQRNEVFTWENTWITCWWVYAYKVRNNLISEPPLES